jgi:KDO2-lipid IV(A) lauroyltransferase
VGRARRWLGPFHFTGVFWYWLPTLAPRILPSWAFPPTAAFFAFVFQMFLVNIRRALVANLRVVLGPCGFWKGQLRAFRTLREFSCSYGDRYESLAFPERFRVTVEGDEIWRAARSRGGLIFVTAHIGAWEMSSYLASSEIGLNVHVVREEELDAKSQEFMSRLVARRRNPNHHTHFATDDPRLGLVLREALGRGEIVALQGDRPRAQSRTVGVTLFGRTCELPAGPLALARLSGVPLLPIFCFRERHGLYRIVCREPIQVSLEGKRDEAIAVAAQVLSAHIEWAIRRHPHQWYALEKVWPMDQRLSSGVCSSS